MKRAAFALTFTVVGAVVGALVFSLATAPIKPRFQPVSA
jgi:hypothetical protein